MVAMESACVYYFITVARFGFFILEINKRIGEARKMKKLFIISIGTIFVLLTVLFYTLGKTNNLNFLVLETGNVIMALLSYVAYIIVKRQDNDKPHAFVRGVYSASFLKLMVCMISILVYVLLDRANVRKQTVFILFGIYVVYTITETRLLSKFVRQ